MITRVVCITVMFLLSLPLQAKAPLDHQIPSCVSSIATLPVYRMSTHNKKGKVVAYGTAWLLSKNLWVTASHVVLDDINTTGYIHLSKTSRIKYTVVKVFPTADVAILQATSAEMTPIRITTTKIKPYERVWNIGFPGMSQGKILSTQGLVMARHTTGSIVQTTAFLLSGMSGGPALRCAPSPTPGLNQLEVYGIAIAYPLTDLDDDTKTGKSFVNSGGSIITTWLVDRLIAAMHRLIKEEGNPTHK